MSKTHQTTSTHKTLYATVTFTQPLVYDQKDEGTVESLKDGLRKDPLVSDFLKRVSLEFDRLFWLSGFDNATTSSTRNRRFIFEMGSDGGPLYKEGSPVVDHIQRHMTK